MEAHPRTVGRGRVVFRAPAGATEAESGAGFPVAGEILEGIQGEERRGAEAFASVARDSQKMKAKYPVSPPQATAPRSGEGRAEQGSPPSRSQETEEAAPREKSPQPQEVPWLPAEPLG